MGLFNKKKVVVEDAVKKPETKVIVFAGVENALVPYHVARLLKAADRDLDILLIDNSQGQELFASVPHAGEIGTAEECYVLSNRVYTESAFEKFDYVIVYIGMSDNRGYFEKADKIFVMCDYTPRSAEHITYLPITKKESPEDLAMVFLNKVSSKIAEKQILQKLPYVQKGTLSFISELTQENGIGYIAFLYNGKQSVSGMSSDWKDMIAEICYVIRENGSYRKLTKSV